MILQRITCTKTVLAIISLIIISGLTVLTTQSIGLKFSATMSGEEVSPPINSNVNGTASFRTTSFDTVI
jgi:hypothetical protein